MVKRTLAPEETERTQMKPARVANGNVNDSKMDTRTDDDIGENKALVSVLDLVQDEMD